MNNLTLKKKNKITASSMEAWASKAEHFGFSCLGFFSLFIGIRRVFSLFS
jgi:hypothetical protein